MFRQGSTAWSKFPSEVRVSGQFHRINALPWQERDESTFPVVLHELNSLVTRPGGSMALRDIQAEMLMEAAAADGLFAAVGVGHGKTLVTALLPTILDCERPAVFVPAALRDKTRLEFQEYAQHFNIRSDIKIMSYSMLSRTNGAEELHEYQPDLIICDEAHKLKSPSSARTKRMRRYIKEHRPKFCALSGTITTTQIQDFSHLAAWCLGKARTPVPTDYNTLKEWGRAINSDKYIKSQTYLDAGGRIGPGVLKAWYDGDPNDTGVRVARRAFFRRMAATPGVVFTISDSCDQPVIIDVITKLPNQEHINENLDVLRERAEGPNGEEYFLTTDIWRVARQLSMGYVSRWEPAPPQQWKDARRDYYQFCREVIKRGKYDTPAQVSLNHPDRREVRDWKAIRETYSYEVVPVWNSDAIVNFAYDWAMRTGGLVWCEQVPVGKALHHQGLPYFGAGKEAALALREHTGPAALSAKAHSVGRNLQRYRDNLILSCDPNGALIEQLMGRTHRQGQEKPVNFTFLAHTEELRKGLVSMHNDSVYLQELTLQPQKLLKAEKSIPELLE